MYTHVLIATDGSKLAHKAIRAGLSLAKRLDAKATAVFVSEPWAAARTCHGAAAVPFDAFEQAAGGLARDVLSEVDDAAKDLGVSCTIVHIKDLTTAEGIMHAAKSEVAT